MRKRDADGRVAKRRGEWRHSIDNGCGGASGGARLNKAVEGFSSLLSLCRGSALGLLLGGHLQPLTSDE